jgi:GntR family transcriptional regulator
MASPLASGSAQPLYLQVYRHIAEQIASGALATGDRLPPERHLLERFEVSRATIRRALRQLVDDGLVDASPGRGWFVRSGPLSEPPNALMSFHELGARHGLTATAEVLERRVRSATLDEAETFGIAPGADVFELRRLRRLDGVAVAVDHSRVPLARAPILADTDFRTASLIATMDECQAGPVRADYVTEAAAAGDEEARHLAIEPGAPVFVATTTGYDAGGRVVELTRGVYRSDRYRFRATLLRRK